MECTNAMEVNEGRATLMFPEQLPPNLKAIPFLAVGQGLAPRVYGFTHHCTQEGIEIIRKCDECVPSKTVNVRPANESKVQHTLFGLDEGEDTAPTRVDELSMITNALSPNFVIWSHACERSQFFRSFLLLQFPVFSHELTSNRWRWKE